MWAAHESCFLFILAAEIFLRSRLDKRGILWYNISIMGSIHPFVAAPFYYWLLLAAAAYALLVPGVGPDPCQIRLVDFSIWQKINLLLLERREHKYTYFLLLPAAAYGAYLKTRRSRRRARPQTRSQVTSGPDGR